MLRSLTLLFFFASCSLFRNQPSLESIDKEKLLVAVKMTGEGRGRLTLGDSQYVFGVDSVLSEDKDWILAVQIPLHGEEVMILNDLRKETVANEETETFELRIENEFRKLGFASAATSETFLKELRTLLRFILAPELGLERSCAVHDRFSFCQLEGQKYTLRTDRNHFVIEKRLNQSSTLQVVAKNLTKSFFAQTEIKLHSEQSEKRNSVPSTFSMEFFW